jgi:hypothetical protein
MTMHEQERPSLVQHWIIVTDEDGSEHLEARWAVESGAGHSPVHQAA